jgi:hypothetical protein
MNRRFFAAKALMLLGALMLAPHFSGARAAPALDVVGNTYTSPTYGYTITWQSPWFFLEESTEETTDFLLLTDGVSFSQFFGGESFGTPADELTGLIAFAATGEGVSNFGPVLDEAGVPIREEGENYAFARYSGTVALDDGTNYETTVHYEIRTISPGLSLAIIADVPSESYAGYDQAWEQLFAGVSVARSDTGLPEPDTGLPAPPSGVGEPGPVFVSGQWRLSVAGSTVGAEHAALGLEAKTGTEWLVVFADVTNFSNVDGTFTVKDLLVRPNDAAEAIDLAASSTRRVARLTNVSPEDGRTVDIPANETARVVFVYTVPAGGAQPTLVLGDQALPISATMQDGLDPATLAAPVGPPELQSGVISGVKVQRAGSDPAGAPGSTQLTVDIDGSPTVVTLTGTEIPVSGECHGVSSQAELLDLIGTTVFLETDPTPAQPSDRYVWIENGDGTRTMLNQSLLEHGSARSDPVADGTRFGSWLAATESEAQAAAAGLWAEC